MRARVKSCIFKNHITNRSRIDLGRSYSYAYLNSNPTINTYTNRIKKRKSTDCNNSYIRFKPTIRKRAFIHSC